jgi:uncharacterized protein DUF222
VPDDVRALELAIAEFDAHADDDFVDPKRLSAAIDRLQGKLCRVLAAAQKRGDHLLTGKSPCSWAADTCLMSRTAAADRLCVGEQLQHLPKIAGALSSGQVGYQAAAVICHLSEQVGEKRQYIDEDDWIGFAQRFSIKDLRYLTYEARQRWDAEGFDRRVEEDYELRSFDISETIGGMYRVDGWLDPVGGAAFKAAVESLARPLGAADPRTSKQRRADAAVEMAKHAMDEGRLPRRNGVRPHISVTTTIEGLKGELGSAAAHLESGMPVSNKTVQRLACDGTLHRVLKADSVVVDVGRATRAVSPSQWRALKARYRACCWPGCDRPINWTNPHHVEFWCHGGRSDLPNLLPLCYYHHRLVHEGRWQVIRAGEGYKFIAPDRPVMTRRRWGESRLAA